MLDVAQPAAVESRPSAERGDAPTISKDRLKKLILEAATGDRQKVEDLLEPFLDEGESLLSCGISAKMGFITTYNFYLLTDRRVGDMEITPLTGAMNFESAYLHKVDAFGIAQPSLFMLRLLLAGSYLSVGFVLLASLVNEQWGMTAFMGAALALLQWVGRPFLTRAYLRIRKSGIFLKLTGSSMGTLIFSDRDRLGQLTQLTCDMTRVKRTLDPSIG